MKPRPSTTLLWGAPGTGKTTSLIELATQRLTTGLPPSQLLILTPSRTSAAHLRTLLNRRLRITLSASPVRSWSSWAFDLLHRTGTPTTGGHASRRPRLISGPEQDLHIRELLDGHQRGYSPAPPWPPHLTPALGTRRFRQDIRQLFDRAAEYGLTASQLAHLGREHQQPAWCAASQLLQEYRDLLEIRSQNTYDAAGLLRAALERLNDTPGILAAEHDRYQLILVDDAQEATPAIHHILTLLGAETELVLAACPETAVQGFRGAHPNALARLCANPHTTSRTLTTSHRLPPAIAASWNRIAETVPTTAGATSRTLTPISPPQPGKAHTALLTTPQHENQYIAEQFLRQHLEHQQSWSHMALIVRSGADIARFQRALGAHGIPTRTTHTSGPLAQEPAAAALLCAYQAVLEPELTAHTAHELLTSKIGGHSALEMRRLKRALRRHEHDAGGTRSSDQLLTEALTKPAQLHALGPDTRAALPTARMLNAGREHLGTSNPNPHTLLWALWEAAGVADTWAQQAAYTTPQGRQANRDLDVIVALFDLAERYTEHAPATDPHTFLTHLNKQELPQDTLAPRADTHDSLNILTPAGAAGRQWPTVIVAGLQEGRWPNTRTRGDTLNTSLLVDILELGGPAARQRTHSHRIRDILHDEARSLSAAISRASHTLICTAVASNAEQPSRFITALETVTGPAHQPDPTSTRPHTLRTLTAHLRRHLETHHATPRRHPTPVAGPPVPESARILALLSRHNTPGADPSHWWGLAPPTTDEPIHPPTQALTLTPSHVKTALTNPQAWFVYASSATGAPKLAQNLGNLIHDIASSHPESERQSLWEELERRWPSLNLPDTWYNRNQKQRARHMLAKYATYLTSMRENGRHTVAVEHPFSVELPGTPPIHLRGRVDRLERDQHNRYVIIDLKTGATKLPQAAITHHEQLGAYQVAANAGAFTPTDHATTPPTSTATGQVATDTTTGHAGGAALIHLGTPTKNYSQQTQAPLEPDDDWATPLLGQAATIMTSSSFPASHNPTEPQPCPIPSICPLCYGSHVTE